MNKIESVKKISKSEIFKEALLYAEGRKKLAEIGFTDESIEEIKPIRMDKSILAIK